MEGSCPDFANVQFYLEYDNSIEKITCRFSRQDKFLSKWKQLKNYSLDNDVILVHVLIVKM